MTLPMLVNFGVYGAAAVLGVFGGLIGFSRGVRRQTIRFISIVLSAVFSFLICLGVYPALNGYLENLTMDEFIVKLEGYGVVIAEGYQNVMRCFEPAIVSHIAALPLALVVLPIIFVILFMIISLLMIIPHKLVSGAIGFTRKNNGIISRVCGLLMGFVQGVVVTAILLMPVGGLVTTLDTSLDTINEKHPGATNAVALTNLYNNYFSGCADNFVMKMTYGISGYVYGSYSIVEVNGEQVDLRESMTSAIDMFVILGDLAKSDFNQLTPEEQKIFSTLTADVYEDRYLALVVSDICRGFAKSVKTGAINITYVDPVGGFIEQLISVLATSTRDNLGEDIQTFQKLYFILCDTDTLRTFIEEPAKVYSKFAELGADGTTVFGKLARTMSQNPRMAGLSAELTKLSMSLLLAGKDQDMEKTEEAMNDVSDTLNNIIQIDKESFETEEEYKATVNETVDTTLKEHGIAIPEKQVEQLTDYLLEEVIKDKEVITEDDVADFMIKYYEIHARGDDIVLPDGTIIPGGTIPEGTIPEGTIPEGTIPEGTIPEGTIPEGTIPEGTIPEGTIPEDTNSGDTNLGEEGESPAE